MNKVFLAIMIVCTFCLSALASATDDVQVLINGRVYQCSEGGGDTSCKQATDAALAKFKACRNAGYAATSCFDSAFKNKLTSCPAWSEACNTTCRSAGYASTSCYDICYN